MWFLGMKRLQCGRLGPGKLASVARAGREGPQEALVLQSVSLKPDFSCLVCPQSDALEGGASRQPGAACFQFPVT